MGPGSSSFSGQNSSFSGYMAFSLKDKRAPRGALWGCGLGRLDEVETLGFPRGGMVFHSVLLEGAAGLRSFLKVTSRWFEGVSVDWITILSLG